MIDYYRLPTDFPGFDDDEAKKGSPHNRVKYLEDKFKATVGHSKFYPYISIHEFESLLFSKPEAIVQEVSGGDSKIQKKLLEISGKYDNPEEINNNNPPSKHILNHLVGYDKVVHGSLIAVEIGVEKMREKCPHFNEWLTGLETLGATS